uniref:Uncharacterized protein n=1 Tax=Maylandia zebra TaxID=106582 RepID=A0A3P9CDD3_9CICH
MSGLPRNVQNCFGVCSPVLSPVPPAGRTTDTGKSTQRSAEWWSLFPASHIDIFAYHAKHLQTSEIYNKQFKKKTHILQQSRTFFSKVSLKQNKLHCKLQKYQSRGASSGPLKQDASLHSTHRFCRAPRCPLLSRRFVDGSWRRCFGPPAPGRSRERTGAPLRRS